MKPDKLTDEEAAEQWVEENPLYEPERRWGSDAFLAGRAHARASADIGKLRLAQFEHTKLKLRMAENEIRNQETFFEQHEAEKKELERKLLNAAKHIEALCSEQDKSKVLIGKLETKLEQIADPRKRDHKEPDLYTERGCMMSMAESALELVKDYREGK